MTVWDMDRVGLGRHRNFLEDEKLWPKEKVENGKSR